MYDPLVSTINFKTVYGTALIWGIGLTSILMALVLSPAFLANSIKYKYLFSFNLLSSTKATMA